MLAFLLCSSGILGGWHVTPSVDPAGLDPFAETALFGQIGVGDPTADLGASPSLRGSAGSQADTREAAIIGALNLRMNNQQNMWFKDGRFPTVVQSLRIQYDFNPHNNDIATNLGWMMENIHLYDEAQAVYEQFRVENPQNPDASFPEGFYFFRMKRYDDEIRLFEAALKAKPHPGPNIYRILGHTYDRLKRYSDAIRVYEAYLAIWPQDGAAKVNLKRVQGELAKSNAGK